MTEIPIIVTTNEVTVGGFVDTINLEVEKGSTGQRGSRMFSGTVTPPTLPANNYYNISEFVVGDVYFVSGGANIGDIWEYQPTPSGNVWVRIVQRMIPPIYTGSGSPNGVVTANPGSLYTNTSGGANTTLYVKESGTGSSGWVAK